MLINTSLNYRGGINHVSMGLRFIEKERGSNSGFYIPEISIDHVVFADFLWYMIDLKELECSTEGDGEYQILNCSCGDPRCARLDGGILVTGSSASVRWEVWSPEPYRRFVFKREEYSKAIYAFIGDLRAARKGKGPFASISNQLDLCPWWE